MVSANTILHWAALREAQVSKVPFPHLIVAESLSKASVDTVEEDFPEIHAPGSFPCDVLRYGPGFSRLLEELQAPDFAALLGEKFGLDLHGKARMFSVRGKCRPTDGKIHIDSKGKILTVLLYMNGPWENEGGRLRLLNGPRDLEDYCVEAPPSRGTLVAFACVGNAWHGHKPFAGPRKVIQLNWVREHKYLRRERRRHKISAFFKNLRRMVRPRLR